MKYNKKAIVNIVNYDKKANFLKYKKIMMKSQHFDIK